MGNIAANDNLLELTMTFSGARLMMVKKKAI